MRVPRFTLIAIAICVLLLPGVAWASAGWTDDVKVVELVPTGRHYYEIQLKVTKNPSGCRNKNWFYIDYQSRGADEMFDLFVEGIQSSLRLRVYVTGICNINGYSEISAVGASPN
jgi:hypothetical protein